MTHFDEIMLRYFIETLPIPFIVVEEEHLKVSWVRHRDIHLLTVGRYTYTTDQRFRAIHQPNTEDYTLMIKYPQHRDSGIYECQISTTPHLSHYVHLNVVGSLLAPTHEV
ncbi:Lachesin [Orchesella cincta]|uniref:Lachesin n=1 Tax=Orchesella cincta TaxID=48709 RepID=A0A1D2N4D7_ORCCI|nr:Lachesin [Orchesella cincta]